MFNDKLKELREKAGISQYELTEKIFVLRSVVAKLKNGLRMPVKESLELLCNFFNILKR
jgi:transcriptional regulator with XRE-family HTH domain